MHLYAAFVPPDEVRHAVTALLTASEAGPPGDAEVRRGFLGRRARPAVEPVEGQHQPQLQLLEPARAVVPVTDFGFLASGDARRLVDALTDVCAGLPPGPTVRVAGGAALVDPDDRCVWADLAASDDDVAALRAVANAVVAGVQPLGLFCDRRQFRARFPIATITEATTVERLEEVLAALATYASDPWTIGEVAIVQRGSGVWRSIPIGG